MPRPALVNQLTKLGNDRRLQHFQKNLARLELSIVDELGFVPLSKTGSLLDHILEDRD